MFDAVLWDEACKMACWHGREEGTYGIDYEEEDIERWAEDYYNYLKELQDATKNSSNN